MEVLPRSWIGLPEDEDITDLSSELSSDEEDFPKGDMYPLSSRRLRTVWIRQVAEAMELLTRALLEEVRQMIEGKLVQQQYQPQNVQVVVQGKDDEAAMFLVNENGVIKCIESRNTHDHVTNSPESAHGALLAFEREQESDDPCSTSCNKLS